MVGANRIYTAFSVRSLRRIALVDIDTTSRNVRRVESPSFIANTECFLAFCLTVCVFTALDVGARRLAVYSRRCTDEARFTFASKGSRRVDTHRRWSTGLTVHSTFVNVDAARSLWFEAILTEALALDTLGIVSTVEVAAAQHVDVGLFAGDLRVRFSDVPLRAETVVTGVGVLADRVIAARFVVRRALIDIDTAPKWISRVFWLARANKATDRIRAYSVFPTRIIKAFVYIFAKQFTPSLESLRAQAFVRSGKVDALGILSASVSLSTLVNVDALAARIGHPRWAAAPEAAGSVGTLGTLGARVIRTLVDICVFVWVCV